MEQRKRKTKRNEKSGEKLAGLPAWHSLRGRRLPARMTRLSGDVGEIASSVRIVLRRRLVVDERVKNEDVGFAMKGL